MSKPLLQRIISGAWGWLQRKTKNPYKKAEISRIKLKWLKHASAGKCRSHKMLGHKFYFEKPTEFLHGIQEIFIDEIYNQELSKNALVIDCGANIGLSVVYLKNKFPDAKILAFEPDEKNYELLEKNCASFELKDIELFKAAVWKESGHITFSQDGSMSSRITEKSTETSIQTVATKRLRDFLDRKVDFLKLDIEGAEFEVLKDCEDLLGNIENMFVEYHGNYRQISELNHLLRIFEKAGFAFYIKEAANINPHPFLKSTDQNSPFDIQLNIFCIKQVI